MDMTVKFVLDHDTLLQYVYNGKTGTIPFCALASYWNHATCDDFEQGIVRTRDNMIIGIMLTANGQGGIVFIWDAEKDCLLHISDGCYAVSTTLWKDSVYTLRMISNFVTKAHFSIDKISFGVLDVYLQPQTIDHRIPFTPDDYNGDPDTIGLTASDEGLQLTLNDHTYLI